MSHCRFKVGELVKVIRPRPDHPPGWLGRIGRVYEKLHSSDPAGHYLIMFQEGLTISPVFDDEVGGV